MFGMALGQLPLSPTEEVSSPKFVSILQQLVNAETSLNIAYSNILNVAQVAGPSAQIPVQILQGYNKARETLLLGAADWLAAREATPADQLPDAGKQPQPPPAFIIPQQPVQGFGFGSPTVAVSQVQVVYGPAGQERTVPLGAAPPFYSTMSGAFGFAPGLLVIIFLGVALVGLTIALVIREWDRAQVEANRAQARVAEAQGKAVENATEKFVQVYLACIGSNTDPTHLVACLESTRQSMARVIESLPEPPPAAGGLGILGTIGVVLLAGAAGVGVYLYVKHRR